MDDKERIKLIGEQVRNLKQQALSSNKLWQKERDIMDLVFELQRLKMKYDDMKEDCGEFPKMMKIRWKVIDSKGNKVRLQHQYHDRIELTGSEVIEDIQKYTEKKYPGLGGMTKLELILKERDEDGVVTSTSYEEINLNSFVRMPLIFPGPILKKNHIHYFRLHFPGLPYHFTTPHEYTKKIPQLIDVGANLYYPEFEPFMDTVLRRSFGAGVTNIALISTNLESTKKNIDYSKQYPGTFWVIAGVHPYEAKNTEFNEENLKKLRNLISDNKRHVFAIGECGYDKHKESMPELSFQRDWFISQLQLSAEFDLPIFIHERGNHEELVNLLRKHVINYPNATIIINCFNGNDKELYNYLSISDKVYIVITGVIGNDQRATELRGVVQNVPLNKLLLATDAPHLIPFNMNKPFPKRNEPGFLPYILTAVCQYKNLSIEEVSEATVKNSFEAFRINRNSFYDGTVNNPNRDIVFTNLQQIEAEKLQIANQKAHPVKIYLNPGEKVFSFNKFGIKRRYIVNEKDYSTLSKQQIAMSPDEFLIFVKTVDVKEVPSNGIIVDRRKKRGKKKK